MLSQVLVERLGVVTLMKCLVQGSSVDAESFPFDFSVNSGEMRGIVTKDRKFNLAATLDGFFSLKSIDGYRVKRCFYAYFLFLFTAAKA